MKYDIVAAVVLASGLACMNTVRAEEPEVKLPEVVVTATKTEKDPKDVTQSVTVISADDIKKSGATSAGEAVRSAVALTVQEYGPRGAVSQISLRGSTSEQVLVLLDGKRLNSPRSGGFNLSDLPVTLDQIERIEIVRGASSALYGADALGGVVNIITKKPERTQYSVSGSSGTHGYDALVASGSGRQGGLYYRFSGGRETYDGFRPNSDLDQKNVGAKIGYQVAPDSSIEITADYIGKEIGVPGSISCQSPLARQWNRDAVSGFGYKTKFSQAVEFNLNAYYKREMLIFKDPVGSSCWPMPADDKHESTTEAADVQLNWVANAWNMITIGTEGRGDDVKSSVAGDHAARVWAGFFQDELDVNESLIFVIGGRYDDHSVYGNKFSPRASARYLISNTATIIRASAGKGFRAPTFNDLYWPNVGWGVGNPNLKPEISKDYDAGVEQSFGKHVIKITAFARKVKNLIKWNDAAFPMYPENIGKASIAGYEAEAKFALSDAVAWGSNYTYTNPVNETAGTKIYTIPKDQLKSFLTISLPSKTLLGLEGRMVKNYPEPARGEKYAVFDVKVSQGVKFTSGITGDLFVGMKNVFDRSYEVVKGYPMPPRELFGGMSVQF